MNSISPRPRAVSRAGHFRFIGTTLLIVGLTTVAVAARAGGAAGSVPVTDPDLLQAMGFEPGEKNIHAMPGALDQLEGIAPVIDGVQPKFGTDDTSYTAVSGSMFSMERPGQSTIQRSIASAFCLTEASGWNQIVAQAPLPTGVSVEFVNFFAGDFNSSENATLFLFESCHEGLNGEPNHTLLGSIASAGNGGSQIRTIAINPPVTVQPAFSCSYNLRVRLGNTSTECFGGGASTGLAVRQVAVNWRRQISPAPGSATFGDVPTGHSFFQHIEALADSGITAGCGGGNYCPDDPLTRGQMAVFLAKALGLHFPL